MKIALVLSGYLIASLGFWCCQGSKQLREEAVKRQQLQDSLTTYYTETLNNERNNCQNELQLAYQQLAQEQNKIKEIEKLSKELNSQKVTSAPKSSVREMAKFPWPPPLASATVRIKPAQLSSRKSIKLLGDASELLEDKLNKSKYIEKSYYAVPGGFALATRIEQINKDGSFKNPGRWSLKTNAMTSFSLSEYIERLFLAPKGYFRVVVFVVTNEPFVQSKDAPSKEQAMRWINEGQNDLEPAVAKMSYTSTHRITALIYEFVKSDQGSPQLSTPSELTGADHLRKAKIIQ